MSLTITRDTTHNRQLLLKAHYAEVRITNSVRAMPEGRIYAVPNQQ